MLRGMSGNFVTEFPSPGVDFPGRVHCFDIREKSVDPIVHDVKPAAAKSDTQELLHRSAELQPRSYIYLLTSNDV
ncbi:hypothetical protein GCM10009689_22010 [Brevibacterium antiquum]